MLPRRGYELAYPISGVSEPLRAPLRAFAGGPNGLCIVAKEGLGHPPLSPPPRDVVASAAVAHQPDVPLCGSAPLPHGDDVIEPHRLLGPALDAPPAVSSPHVHLHPRGGQRVPNGPGPAPMLQARASPVQRIVVCAGIRLASKTFEQLRDHLFPPRSVVAPEPSPYTSG